MENEGAVTMIKCEECNGSGEVYCYACSQPTDCDECDGTGEIEDETNKQESV